MHTSVSFTFTQIEYKLPLFSLIVLCDEIRVEVLQGHLSLGGLVQGVSAEADVVRASHLQHPCNNICNILQL